MLSGNRNFEGRIHPDCRMNYLASPPLVVAYTLAGTMDIDLATTRSDSTPTGAPVYLRDLWPSSVEVARSSWVGARHRHVPRALRRRPRRRRALARAGRTDRRSVRMGPDIHVHPQAAVPRGHPAEAGPPLRDVEGARVLALLGDSVTTDHISPAGSIRRDEPGADSGCSNTASQPRDFNSYGSRRGNHEVMVRGTFANVRLRNRLAPGTEGGVTLHLPDGDQMTIYDAAMQYAARRACRSSCSRARSTARVRRATGPPRARSCSACGQCSPRASSASTGRTSSGWVCSRSSSVPASPSASLGLTGHEEFRCTGVAALADDGRCRDDPGDRRAGTEFDDARGSTRRSNATCSSRRDPAVHGPRPPIASKARRGTFM